MKPGECACTTRPRERSASFLSPPDFHRLDWACRPIYHAYKTPPYLVGSVLLTPAFRDIDLRLIIDDDVYAGLAPSREIGVLMDIALSRVLMEACPMRWPIDFQIQSQTEANEFGGVRNPMGMRW